MSTAPPLHDVLPGTVQWADKIAQLATVASPDASACIWRRTPHPAARAFAEAAAARPVSITTVIAPGRIHDLVDALPDLDGRDAFIADLAQLCDLYETLVGSAALGVRLQSLDTPMCPRFHVDRVTLRLVCTWCGPGTEILDDPFADRSLLGAGSGGVDDQASGLIRAPARLVSAAPGDVVLLKGERWPDNEGRGVIHRSPHRPGRRLLFSLDALSEA